MNPIREGSRDSVLMDLSQDGPDKETRQCNFRGENLGESLWPGERGLFSLGEIWS